MFYLMAYQKHCLHPYFLTDIVVLTLAHFLFKGGRGGGGDKRMGRYHLLKK